MTDPFGADEDATPLTPQERDGLVPTHVALRSELNELEQQNIAAFLKGLHRRMFNRVWRWAGEYRTTERNLGVPPFPIQPDLRQTIGDGQYWISHRAYAPDELAVRFHHRLVVVHPFPTGNGRWSRLAADLLIVKQGAPRFTWGRANLRAASDVRREYINALHAADDHDFAPLIRFARS